ncbi:hypothetical protein D3C75_1346160 [compost metagenome]
MLQHQMLQHLHFPEAAQVNLQVQLLRQMAVHGEDRHLRLLLVINSNGLQVRHIGKVLGIVFGRTDDRM